MVQFSVLVLLLVVTWFWSSSCSGGPGPDGPVFGLAVLFLVWSWPWRAGYSVLILFLLARSCPAAAPVHGPMVVLLLVDWFWLVVLFWWSWPLAWWFGCLLSPSPGPGPSPAGRLVIPSWPWSCRVSGPVYGPIFGPASAPGDLVLVIVLFWSFWSGHGRWFGRILVWLSSVLLCVLAPGPVPGLVLVLALALFLAGFIGDPHVLVRLS